ncbi:MAG: hypothetical protein V3R81_12070 [Gammaproteobacteria bacterium]
MTLAIGFRTHSLELALTLAIARYQFDPLLLALAAAFAVAATGLVATGLLSLVVVSPVIYLPALIGGCWLLLQSIELLLQEAPQ